jgi:hypothetical protein
LGSKRWVRTAHPTDCSGHHAPTVRKAETLLAIFSSNSLAVQHLKFFAQFFQPFGKNKIIWTSLGHTGTSPRIQAPALRLSAMVVTLHSHATVT